jgi:hypothetical protein
MNYMDIQIGDTLKKLMYILYEITPLMKVNIVVRQYRLR